MLLNANWRVREPVGEYESRGVTPVDGSVVSRRGADRDPLSSTARMLQKK